MVHQFICHRTRIRRGRRWRTYIMRFARIHIVFMLKLGITAHDCCILRPDDALQSLHELAKDSNARLRRQNKWSRSILSMAPDRWTKSCWADAFNGGLVVLLHSVELVSLEVGGCVRSSHSCTSITESKQLFRPAIVSSCEVTPSHDSTDPSKLYG
jgi:hypothetical protein